MTIQGNQVQFPLVKDTSDQLADEIAARIIFALSAEVVTRPKPGLVTSTSTGSHLDMDVFTFLQSASHLYSTFRQSALAASSEIPIEFLMKTLRLIGKNGEKIMCNSTRGVNTHRGAIFLGGLFAAATAIALQTVKPMNFNPKRICSIAQAIAAPTLISDQSWANTQPISQLSVGQRVNRLFGIKGIRGEVLDGFPSILENGLPALQAAYQRGANRMEAQAHSLIALLAVVQDSTVLNRGEDPTRLLLVQRLGQNILSAGSIFTGEGMKLIEYANSVLKRQSISPGGCADLLAICIFLDDLSRLPFGYNIDDLGNSNEQ